MTLRGTKIKLGTQGERGMTSLKCQEHRTKTPVDGTRILCSAEAPVEQGFCTQQKIYFNDKGLDRHFVPTEWLLSIFKNKMFKKPPRK